MALPLRDTKHHTYADYLTWSDDQQYELIDGIAYVKEPGFLKARGVRPANSVGCADARNNP